MPRHQLLELEDLPWCPAVIRDAVTDHLRFLIELAEPYAAVVPLLADALERSGQRQVLDLASGAGGPWRHLHRRLAERGVAVSVRLSDKYPNAAAAAALARRGPEGVTYVAAPVDAAHVPPELPGFRTVFSSFHHFPPDEAVAVLADAVTHGRGIAVFEALGRGPRCLLLACLNGLLVPLVAPFVRPFRWSRLLWTYLVPVLPIVMTFDGLVSCRRAYTPQELLALADRVTGSGYAWVAGLARGRWPMPITYLTGIPRGDDGDREAVEAPRPVRASRTGTRVTVVRGRGTSREPRGWRNLEPRQP